MFFRALLPVTLLLCPTLALAQRAIPDDNLAYPVLINLTDCTDNVNSIQGTGFFLSTATTDYLLTARHLLFNLAAPVAPNQPRPLQCKKAELLSYSKDPKEKQWNRFSLDLQTLNQAGRVKPHLTRDVAVVQMAAVLASTPAQAATASGGYTVNMFPGVAINETAPSGVLGVALDTVTKFDQVLASNDVYVLGYPRSIGLQQAPQIDYSTPLLRKGIIAGTNNTNKTIVLDCMTFHGNSGGPVLELVHKGFGYEIRVIGVVSQYVPVAETWVNLAQGYSNTQLYNSGYSIAEPMDAVLELLNQ